MPLPVQAKMLRLLQDQTFERVGGQHALTTRVRVLAATNQDLEKLIAAGRFRGDLYYRLKEVTIRVPPLRDRKADIPELAHHFLFQFARETDRDIRGFAPEVISCFQDNPWPGNVRELRGVIRDAALRAIGPLILPESLAPGLGLCASTAPEAATAGELVPVSDLARDIELMLREEPGNLYARVIGSVERELIARVLRHTQGHQGRACELLGIDRKTLRNKLRDLGITVDRVVSERPDSADG
jgi:two-component system nitrogen regulation response regulator GlnG